MYIVFRPYYTCDDKYKRSRNVSGVVVKRVAYHFHVEIGEITQNYDLEGFMPNYRKLYHDDNSLGIRNPIYDKFWLNIV